MANGVGSKVSSRYHRHNPQPQEDTAVPQEDEERGAENEELDIH